MENLALDIQFDLIQFFKSEIIELLQKVSFHPEADQRIRLQAMKAMLRAAGIDEKQIEQASREAADKALNTGWGVLFITPHGDCYLSAKKYDRDSAREVLEQYLLNLQNNGCSPVMDAAVESLTCTIKGDAFSIYAHEKRTYFLCRLAEKSEQQKDLIFAMLEKIGHEAPKNLQYREL